MKGKRKRLAVATIVVVALAVTSALLVMAGPATADEFAHVDVLKGTVEVRPDGESIFQPADDGQTVGPGDVVRTGSDGRAAIEYFDGSVTRLDADTAFRLEELSSVQGGGKIIEAEQLGGQTFNRVTELTDSASRFDVDTPTATASVRGTIFTTRHLFDDTSLVWVLEGQVLVSSDHRSKIPVGPLHGVTVRPDGTTSGVYRLSDAQLNDPWIRFNLCALEGRLDLCEPAAPRVREAPAAADQPQQVSGDTGGSDVVLGTVVTRDDDRTTTKDDGGNGGNGGGGGGADPDPPKPPDDPDPPDPKPPTLVEQVCEVVEDTTALDVPPPVC